jgi:hypothetical protein
MFPPKTLKFQIGMLAPAGLAQMKGVGSSLAALDDRLPQLQRDGRAMTGDSKPQNCGA